MLRSLYSGVTGMKAHQVRMDVIGNNIANVNTTGFKGGRMNFSDMLNQTIRGAIAPGEGGAGINPAQVGLGVKIGGIDTMFTQGGLQVTDRVTDLAIQGNGFFVVNSPINGQDNFSYTRDGALSLDKDGYLVHTATGMRLQGWTVDPDTGVIANPNGDVDAGGNPVLDLKDVEDIEIKNFVDPVSGNTMELLTFSFDQEGMITGLFEDPNGGEPVAKKMGKLAIASFFNLEGLYKKGNNLYQLSLTSGAPKLNNGMERMESTIESGYLEMSNIDLTAEFTNMIITQRGFQANSRIITTSDSMLEELLSLKR